MNLTTIGSREAQHNFADLIGRVYNARETVIVERAGQPVLAMIPMPLYEQLVAEREARFQVLDRIQQHLPDVSEEEVAEDVAEAIAAVRRQAKQG